MANFLNLSAFLNLNASGFKVGLKQAESQAKAFGGVIKSEFAKAFGYAAVISFTKNVIDSAERVVDLSNQLGISTKALQEWGYAARKNGADIEKVVSFFENLAQARDDALEGSTSKLDAFGVFGLSEDDLRTMRLEDIGKRIGDSIQHIDPQTIIAPLKEIGGKGAIALINAFQAGLGEMATAAQEAGQVFEDSLLNQMKSMKDEASNFADILRGPISVSLSHAFRLASGIAASIRAAVEGVGAFFGTLSGGGSFKDAMSEASRAAYERTIQDLERRRDLESPKPQIQQSYFGRKEDEKETDLSSILSPKARKEQARAAMESINVNSWQRLGAAVRFSPEVKHLQNIERNTAEMARRLQLLKGNFSNSMEGFGP